MDKSPEAFRTISEVAEDLDVPQHVLRFWESKFSHIRPMKRGGGRRYYRPGDVELLRGIRHLLYGEGFTIRGVQKILRERGPSFVVDCGKHGAVLEKAGDDAEDGTQETERATEPAFREPRAEAPAPPGETAAGEAGLSPDQEATLREVLADLSSVRTILTGRED